MSILIFTSLGALGACFGLVQPSQGVQLPDMFANRFKNFVRELLILNGASQHNSADQRCRLKDGLLPLHAARGENFLKCPLAKAALDLALNEPHPVPV